MAKTEQLSYVLHEGKVQRGGRQNGKRQSKLEKTEKRLRLSAIVKEHLVEDTAKTLAHYTLTPNKYNKDNYEIFLTATKVSLYKILMEQFTSKKRHFG